MTTLVPRGPPGQLEPPDRAESTVGRYLGIYTGFLPERGRRPMRGNQTPSVAPGARRPDPLRVNLGT